MSSDRSVPRIDWPQISRYNQAKSTARDGRFPRPRGGAYAVKVKAGDPRNPYLDGKVRTGESPHLPHR